jgi:hypothetical protein
MVGDDDDYDEPQEPCALTPEDDPSMLDPPIVWPVGPGWWDGRWPQGGINSLADLEGWVNARLEEMIWQYQNYRQTLGSGALMLGRQTVENTTRYLARVGKGDHPPRPKPEQLRDFADIQNALEALLRYIKKEQGATPVHPAVTSAGEVERASTSPTTAAHNQPAAMADPSAFLIDFTTFSVRWRALECPLGNTKPFHVLVRLAKRPGRFVTVRTLTDDVWGDSTPDKNTVQKTIGTLRKKLDAAGMGDLISAEPDNYALSLPSGVQVHVVRPDPEDVQQ